MFILNIFFKEWIRTGGIRKILQIIMSFIFPITLYIIFNVLPAMINGSKALSYFSAGLLIYLFTGIYAIYYTIESDAKIFNEFPIDYIPIRKSFLYFVNIIFTLFLSIIIVYTSIFITVFIFSRFTINDIHFFSFIKTLKFLKALLIGLPYMILTGIITGSFLGIIGKKIGDNFNENAKQIFFKIYIVILFFALKGYFKKIYIIIRDNDFSNNLFLFSPIYFASIISHIVYNGINLLYVIISFSYNVLLFLLFIIIADKKININFIPILNFSYNKKNIDILSPLWNIMIKRFYSVFMIIFLFLWFLIIFINGLFLKNVFIQGLFVNPGLMLFIFLFIDKISPKKNEDYKFLWESFPINKEHILGVFLGSYYILFLIPVYIFNKMSLTDMMNFSQKIVYPATISGFLLKIFPYITFSAIIPFLIYLYPILWSSQTNKKKITKRDFILSIFFIYIGLSAVMSISIGYIFSENMRIFIHNMLFGYGYYLGKLLFYSIILYAIYLHIKSIYYIILSFIYKK